VLLLSAAVVRAAREAGTAAVAQPAYMYMNVASDPEHAVLPPANQPCNSNLKIERPACCCFPSRLPIADLENFAARRVESAWLAETGAAP
jgi:hypothetical protein